MHRLVALRVVTPKAPDRGAKVIALRARREARREQRIPKQPTRPDAA